MVSVVLCAVPAEGHARPMLAVARVLVARGWRVRVLTGAAFADAVAATGAEFLPLPVAAETLGTAPGEERLRGVAALNRGLARTFFDPAPAAFAALREALREPTDAVLSDTAFVGAAGLEGLPAAERPLAVVCGVIPLGVSSRDTAPFGMGIPPRPGVLGRGRNRLLGVLARRVVLRSVHREADRVLRALGAAPLDGAFFLDALGRADLLAQFTVAEFEYPRSDAPSNLRFLGPTTRLAPSAIPLPEWWDRLDGSRPVVHVSQGTVANTDFDELIVPTLEALRDEDVTVVVATGGRPIGELPPLPANALAAPLLPYDRLLPLTDVFVSNGGYGGLHFALEHGAALVVAGDTEDKVETCARVAWSGAGVDLRTGRPTTAAIRGAVRRVLADPSFARRSAAIGESIRRSPGAEGLADLIEETLAARAVTPPQ